MSESTIQPDLVNLKSKLATEIERDQKEHELIGKRIAKNRELLQAVNASLGVMRPQAQGGNSISNTIRAAISALDKQTFTPVDVDRVLMELFPEVKISKEDVRGRLWTMKKKGELTCLEKGVGNVKPSVYAIAARFKGGGTVFEVPRAIDTLPRKRTRTLVPANGELLQ